MNFVISAKTDIGIVKKTNQDSVLAMTINTGLGRMVFALLCDGMGGLAKGEVASASVIKAFKRWVYERLPELCQGGALDDNVIKEEWNRIVWQQNESIKQYGRGIGISLGTTAVALLLTQSRSYVMNVGDSRCYELVTELRQMTVDQTLVNREISLGNLTPEEAENDPRRSVLLQCIGASENVYPDFFFGEPLTDAVYMLCSDGFRHELTPDEIFQNLQPSMMYDEYSMGERILELIELNKSRQERDNISVIAVRTF